MKNAQSEKTCCRDMTPDEKAYILLAADSDPRAVICPSCMEQAERLIDKWADGVLAE